MIGLRSKITRELLRFFFLHKEESFYINQLAKTLQLDRGNLIKKLKEMEAQGLFQSEFRGHQKYYSLNKKCLFYKEYESIVRKTVGFEKELGAALKKIHGIQQAWIFGSYAKNQMDALSDIDLLVVGSHGTTKLYAQLVPFQKKYGRTINTVNMSPKEFDKKMALKDPFLKGVFQNRMIQII